MKFPLAIVLSIALIGTAFAGRGAGGWGPMPARRMRPRKGEAAAVGRIAHRFWC